METAVYVASPNELQSSPVVGGCVLLVWMLCWLSTLNWAFEKISSYEKPKHTAQLGEFHSEDLHTHHLVSTINKYTLSRIYPSAYLSLISYICLWFFILM